MGAGAEAWPYPVVGGSANVVTYDGVYEDVGAGILGAGNSNQITHLFSIYRDNLEEMGDMI